MSLYSLNRESLRMRLFPLANYYLNELGIFNVSCSCSLFPSSYGRMTSSPPSHLPISAGMFILSSFSAIRMYQTTQSPMTWTLKVFTTNPITRHKTFAFSSTTLSHVNQEQRSRVAVLGSSTYQHQLPRKHSRKHNQTLFRTAICRSYSQTRTSLILYSAT